MRLLQLNDQGGVTITENLVKDIPPYAILSHTWLADQDEVTFKEVKKGLGQDKEGYKKIIFCGEEARRDGISHFWVDTCCIDKRSSAELSEAINSMFQWYRKSAICYAYLSDIDHEDDLSASSWFKRGWTLQELLAPSTVQFFTRDWRFLSERDSMLSQLQEITSIPQKALSDFRSQDFRVAEKMSWSASRVTTREEDLAYCLLGLYDINIPLIYGEGSKAFLRLQQAIMDQSTDLSLFLWTGSAYDNFGTLAAAPSSFGIKHPALNSNHLWRAPDHSSGWTRNNAGISLELSLKALYLNDNKQAVFIAIIHEPVPFSRETTGYGIFLETIDHLSPKEQYKRITVDGETFTELPRLDLPKLRGGGFQTNVQIVSESITGSSSAGYYAFTINWQCSPNAQVRVYQNLANNPKAPTQHWPLAATEQTGTSKICLEYKRTEMDEIFAFVVITYSDRDPLLIWLGFDTRFQPICMVMVCLLDFMNLQALKILGAYYNLFCSNHNSNPDEDGAFDTLTGAYALRAPQGSKLFCLYDNTLDLLLGLSVLQITISKEFWGKRLWVDHGQRQTQDEQRKLFPSFEFR